MDLRKVVMKVGIKALDVHQRIYIASGGRIGHRLGPTRNLLLHTTGAKTGQSRTNALTYASDGTRYLVVPSNGGAARWPAWYHNLRAHPDVSVNVGTRRLDVRASFVRQDDPAFDRLWDLVNKHNGNRYRGYQKHTSRRIPVVVLTPR